MAKNEKTISAPYVPKYVHFIDSATGNVISVKRQKNLKASVREAAGRVRDARK